MFLCSMWICQNIKTDAQKMHSIGYFTVAVGNGGRGREKQCILSDKYLTNSTYSRAKPIIFPEAGRKQITECAHKPLKFGKYVCRSDVWIFSARMSFLFRKRMMEELANHGEWMVVQKSDKLSFMRFCGGTSRSSLLEKHYMIYQHRTFQTVFLWLYFYNTKLYWPI